MSIGSKLIFIYVYLDILYFNKWDISNKIKLENLYIFSLRNYLVNR